MNSVNIQRKSLKIINSNLLKIGLDIGGSLTKLSVALHKNSVTDMMRTKLLNDYGFFEEIDVEENFLYIKNFQTNKFNSDTMNFLKQMNSQEHLNEIYATGGGAYKFYEIIEKELGIKLEMVFILSFDVLQSFLIIIPEGILCEMFLLIVQHI